MPPRTVGTAIACLLLVVATSFAELRSSAGNDRITNFKTQLAGTIWRAIPNEPLRPGLGGMLMFTGKTVESAGYRYEVSSQDSLTLFFNHGDKQVFRLAPDGKHLKLSFKNKNYAYDLVSTGKPDTSEFRIKLAGTTWIAAPNSPLRPGLVATLGFTENTVGPAAYLYYVNDTENLTLYFDYGDAQPMVLSADGKRLSFTWKGRSYVYEVAP